MPEGLIEFVPELGALIAELNDVLASEQGTTFSVEELAPKLKQPGNAELLKYLPAEIAAQLLLERDAHGNVNVSSIETEKLIFACAMQELRAEKESAVDVEKIVPQFHFFGFEGRSALPSVFDTNYCYALGYNAGVLLAAGKTGVISTVSNLKAPVHDWTCGGMPLTHMMNIERRSGKEKPVIKKALTDLKGKPFRAFASARDAWATGDHYRTPGPIQFDGGPGAEAITETLRLEIEQREEESKSAQHREKRQRTVANPSISALSAARLAKDASDHNALPTILTGNKLPTLVPRKGVQRARGTMAQMKRFFPHLNSQAPLVELVEDEKEKHARKMTRMGVVFCGRQSPGGHNIIEGLWKTARKGHPDSKVFGFRNGTRGLFKGDVIEINEELLASTGTRNHGGYHLLGRSVDCMNLPENLAAIERVVCDLQLDGLVCIGGTHTACDVATVANFLRGRPGHASKCSVIAVPATIDGDMVSQYVPATVGFHSNARVCAELVGNIASDCNSAKKYWYWIRMMGRRPSHVALEVALQTCPNAVLIGEKIQREQKSLADLVSDLADLICRRHAEEGKNFGVILVPEGLLTFIPEMASLLRDLEATGGDIDALSPWSRALFDYLPEYIRREMLLTRETGGTPQLSQIETEKMMRELVGRELRRRKLAGTYKGTYKTVSYFAGYQARCTFPSAFDAALGETLGATAALLVASPPSGAEYSGYLASCRNMQSNGDGPAQWKPFGVPLTALLNADENRPRFVPTLVDCDGEGHATTPFNVLEKGLKTWAVTESYRNPGPMQFPNDATAQTWDAPLSLHYSSLASYVDRVGQLQATLKELSSSCELGISDAALRGEHPKRKPSLSRCKRFSDLNYFLVFFFPFFSFSFPSQNFNATKSSLMFFTFRSFAPRLMASSMRMLHFIFMLWGWRRWLVDHLYRHLESSIHSTIHRHLSISVSHRYLCLHEHWHLCLRRHRHLYLRRHRHLRLHRHRHLRLHRHWHLRLHRHRHLHLHLHLHWVRAIEIGKVTAVLFPRKLALKATNLIHALV